MKDERILFELKDGSLTSEVSATGMTMTVFVLEVVSTIYNEMKKNNSKNAENFKDSIIDLIELSFMNKDELQDELHKSIDSLVDSLSEALDDEEED